MKKYNGQLVARQSFNGSWFVECHNGKSCITVKSGLTEVQAQCMIEAA